MTSVNTTQFDTSALEDAISNTIPNLLIELEAFRATIDDAYSNAATGDLDFNPVILGAPDQNTGLLAYKEQLSTINTTLSTLIDILDVQINGNASLLVTEIYAIKNVTIATIV